MFCSFNQIFKLNPQLWDDWCHILQAVPGSVLWLAPPGSETTAQNLREETARRGVAPERLVFARRQPLAAHQARIALADIALDTFPYNSGTTASDVLRAGVPLVTRAGETFVSRMAASLLNAVGLPELVAVGQCRLPASGHCLGEGRATPPRAARCVGPARCGLVPVSAGALCAAAGCAVAGHAHAGVAQRRDTIVLPPQILKALSPSPPRAADR